MTDFSHVKNRPVLPLFFKEKFLKFFKKCTLAVHTLFKKV